MIALARHVVASPVGALTLVADDDGLVAVLWPEAGEAARVPLPALHDDAGHPVLRAAADQLAAYFAGERRAFDLRLAPRGTAFQRCVWTALAAIPFGETRSYADIAAAIGSPVAVRAVGAANGRNPISIIVPCHRVVGSTGKLTGFAGGMTAKAQLLALERRDGELPFG